MTASFAAVRHNLRAAGTLAPFSSNTRLPYPWREVGCFSDLRSKAATFSECCGVPAQVLVEAERLRPNLEALLAEADYVFTSAKYPQVSFRPIPYPTNVVF